MWNWLMDRLKRYKLVKITIYDDNNYIIDQVCGPNYTKHQIVEMASFWCYLLEKQYKEHFHWRYEVITE